MGILFSIRFLVVAALGLVLLAGLVWHLVFTFPKLLRRLRFGIFDLFFLITVAAICLGALRATWDTPFYGYALLVPLVAPLLWLARFALDDRREYQARREKLKQVVLPELPTADELSEQSAQTSDETPGKRSKGQQWWQKAIRRSTRSRPQRLWPRLLDEPTSRKDQDRGKE